jgi:phosphoglycolate phosphatase-like HAD superfamily hydrolase
VTTVLLWDIDGTLLSTARAGVAALLDAAREVCGSEPDLDTMKTAGLTDGKVMQLVAGACGGPDDEATIRRMLDVYERELPSRLPERQGRVMPNVVEILEDLTPRDDVHNLLLTGNTPTGARAKLRHYGLDHFFPGDGAFCVDLGDRDSIARRAWDLALAVVGDGVSTERTFVIGDTPHDVACGKAIGVRTIAVATSTHDEDELAASEPWAVLPQLPEPAEFARLLGLPVRCAS